MAFALCLRLGFKHPDDLLDALTLEQWHDWIAFANVSPVGDDRQDLLLTRISCQIAAACGTRIDISEAMPRWGDDTEDRQLEFLRKMVHGDQH